MSDGKYKVRVTGSTIKELAEQMRRLTDAAQKKRVRYSKSKRFTKAAGYWEGMERLSDWVASSLDEIYDDGVGLLVHKNLT